MTEDEKSRSQSPPVEYRDERDMEQFWANIEPRREPIQKRWFLPLVLIILVISVPWYWPEGTVGKKVMGLPFWFWITIGCSVAISCVTAMMALLFWDDDEFHNE